MEKRASALLYKAVQLDNEKRYTGALYYYKKSLQPLLDIMKESIGEKKLAFEKKAKSIIDRAEWIKKHMEELKANSTYHERISIADGSTGYGYKTIFGTYLSDDVTSIFIEDAYIRSFHQCQNLVRLMELVVTKCPSFKKLTLVTGRGEDKQEEFLEAIQENLKYHGVNFEYRYSATLHDRSVVLSNGWNIKIGRGLDYFKTPGNKFVLGSFDSELRHCQETTVDVFYVRDLKDKCG